MIYPEESKTSYATDHGAYHDWLRERRSPITAMSIQRFGAEALALEIG